MASSSANRIPLFFFFFFFFLFLLQIHARDSRQFFSKTTREPATKALAPSETTTNVNAHQDTPTLTPQTHNNNGYGLYGTRTSTVVGTYNYNGGRSRPADDDSQEYSSEVYSYRKQWRPIDDSNRPREFENQIDHDAQSLYSANDDERNYKYPDSRYSNSRWKGNSQGYGVYNYNGGTSGGYYESSGRYGYGSGYGHNDAKEEEYQNKNHEMEENQEEFTP